MKPRSRLTGVLLTIVLIAIAAGAAHLLRGPELNSDDLLKQARISLARGDHPQAEKLARQAAACRVPSPWALLVAAEAALKTNRYTDALDYYRQVPRVDSAVADAADFGEAEMLCHLARISEGERQLRALLSRQPHHQQAHYRLAFLLNITGRRWEAQPHLLFLVKNRVADIEHLLLLGNPQRQIEDRALLETTARQFPTDPLPKLGAARLALSLNRPDEARPILIELLSALPQEPETQVRWGQLLLDEFDPDSFVAWSSGLSMELERHPDVWMLRGQFAQRRGDVATAARCFWEVLRRNPEHQSACHQLGRTLTELKQQDRAVPFLQRAETLQRLSAGLDDLFHHRDHVESMRRVAMLTAELGRWWETASWSSFALSIDPALPWAQQLLREAVVHLTMDLPQTAPANDLSRQIDLSDIPLPAWTSLSQSVEMPSSLEVSVAVIRFQDDAPRLGVDFQYENAADDSTPGARIFETTGGGVGAIDFDQDGWTDLYLTQGGSSSIPNSATASAAIDRLFRNQFGEFFIDVSRQAGIGDLDFSQGVAVGDFNNDGFADVYVANLGQNRLYQNQGDGTFADITQPSGISESWWTTSCLIADLNGDGLPDIYDVNYVGGDSLLTRICEKQGVIRSCSPRAFDPAPDRLWLNQGDGRFRDVTSECGIDVPNGNGLGIMAFDLEGKGRLSLFVANDEVPNFLFVNRADSQAKPLQFDEQGLIAGVALDADGRSQACMGVAADDADGDGLVDLFVTNFYRESNTFYRQLSPGQFADQTRTARLRDPGFAMLGFGAQFLDADLDGWEDLVVTNGHIDDLTVIGEPYKMPTQILRNTGQGRFIEIPATVLGPFFQTNHLGRGLARVDYNRDGRDDFVVSHLREPVAILTNTTISNGHFLEISLRGTRCSRDAFGTTVEVTAGGRRFVKQLMAGNGYHASNERRLRFGLGSAFQIDTLCVRWPGGDSQSWTGIPVDRELLLIEAAPQPVTIP
jgi:tetratricopeptide (TPR) repeat protein